MTPNWDILLACGPAEVNLRPSSPTYLAPSPAGLSVAAVPSAHERLSPSVGRAPPAVDLPLPTGGFWLSSARTRLLSLSPAFWPRPSYARLASSRLPSLLPPARSGRPSTRIPQRTPLAQARSAPRVASEPSSFAHRFCRCIAPVRCG